jgi:type IV pilus assembly protein PilY1
MDGTTMSLTSSNLWLGNSASTSYTGLRFGSVNIPRGTTIKSAYVKVYSQTTQWIQLSFSINGEATGNSSTFGSSLLSSKALTSAQVSYSSNENWTANSWYNLSDITSIIQEIVNRSDWNANNSLSLIMKGTGSAYGRKFIYSFDGGSAYAPQLVINY